MSDVTLIRAVQTSIACPAQWDAWDAEGNYYYLRYRHGYGSIRRYTTKDWYLSGEDELIGEVASFEHGDQYDGDISLEEFAERAGITLAPQIYVAGFGDHLRDELIQGGVIGFPAEEDGL